ncbi:hypothetical protein ACJIZ3_024581 [Penstemon smallii]|uniref:Glycosyl transferase family 51 domain-containing protein n=1 Tax=Penstemon smallii TaxID=265156 RepID=A0ABD3TSJ9_9LAMI
MGCATATTPTIPTIPCKKAPPFAFTAKTHIKPIKTKHDSPLSRLHYSLTTNNINKTIFSQSVILFTFSFSLLLLRLTSGILLPKFSQRWRNLIAFSSQAEAELIDGPEYLFKAVVAYEDRRFFSHFGVDPIGLARAVLSLSARGGGSTITQQLVKNTFLKNERTLMRKFVELVLAVALERRISKLRILSSYLCKVKHDSSSYTGDMVFMELNQHQTSTLEKSHLFLVWVSVHYS